MGGKALGIFQNHALVSKWVVARTGTITNWNNIVVTCETCDTDETSESSKTIEEEKTFK